MRARSLLLVVGALLATVGLVVAPSERDRARDGLATPAELGSLRAPVVAPPTRAAVQLEELARDEAPTAPTRANAETAAWSVAGRVRHGTYGVLPDAPLVITLHAGREATGATLAEARVRSDASGAFAWTTRAPIETVTVSVIPELEGYKVGASTRTVLLGDPGPDDMAPYAYALDTRITGRVIDEQGNAVADALVFSQLSESRTSAEGRYALSMHSEYHSPSFRVLAAGYATQSFAVGGLRAGEVQGPDVVLRKERVVRGRVLDASGAPIAGATVASYPFDRWRTTSSETGHYRLGGFDPEQQRTRISASLDGFVGASQSLEAGALNDTGEVELDLVLERGARVSGRVVDEHGEPVANAIVCWGEYPNSSGSRTVPTDAAGAFELVCVPTGGHSIWARRTGFVVDRIRVDVPAANAVLPDLEIVLRPGFEIAGRVLDEDDRPIVGAEVRPVAGNGSEYAGDSATTDADGRFVLRELATEQIAVRLFAEGCVPQEEVLRAGTEVVLRIRRAGGLAGLVVDGATGQPIDAFTVRFVTPRLELGEPQLFRFGAAWSQSGMSFRGTAGVWDSSPEQLEIGCITGIEVNAPGYAPAVLDRVVVSVNPEPHALRIEMYDGVLLRGVVIDAATGAPLANARVRAFPGGYRPGLDHSAADDGRRTITDEHGRFELSRVPFGNVALVVDETDLPPFIDGPFEIPTNVATFERTIEISTGGRIVGRYLHGLGAPLAEQRVTLYGLDQPTEPRVQLTTLTDAEGGFAFEGLAPGQYHLRAAIVVPTEDAGPGILQLVRLEDGQTLEQDLRPTGSSTVTGTLEYEGELPENLPVELVPVQQVPSEWATRSIGARVEGRSFHATGLEAGDWTVRVFGECNEGLLMGQAKVTVPEAGEASVRIKLRLMPR